MPRLNSAPQDTSIHPTHETTDPVKENDLVKQLLLVYFEGETDGVVDFLTTQASPFMFGDDDGGLGCGGLGCSR